MFSLDSDAQQLADIAYLNHVNLPNYIHAGIVQPEQYYESFKAKLNGFLSAFGVEDQSIDLILVATFKSNGNLPIDYKKDLINVRIKAEGSPADTNSEIKTGYFEQLTCTAIANLLILTPLSQVEAIALEIFKNDPDNTIYELLENNVSLLDLFMMAREFLMTVINNGDSKIANLTVHQILAVFTVLEAVNLKSDVITRALNSDLKWV